MPFIKGAWRIVMVVKDALVLLFLLLFFGLLYAALSAVRPTAAPITGALVITLDGVVVEQPAQQDPLALIGETQAIHEYRLRDVVHAIETAARDNRVKAVAIDLSRFMGAGQVSAMRIGRALDTVRRAGKPVLVHSLLYDDSGYAIAAHASEVWLDPFGMVALAGPGGSQLYYKGLIDRLGITANIYRVGTYKSFVEPFIRTDQSPESREASTALAGSLWESWTDNTRRARPQAPVADYAANPLVVAERFGGDAAEAALKLKLVDRKGDIHAFADRLIEVAGEDSDNPLGFAGVTMEEYLLAHPAGKTPGKVGVVSVVGDIVDGEAGPGMAGADTIAGLIADALADQTIEALVVRVDSPGGSVTAAETIRQAVNEAREADMPVVISMGDVAASGGYWISTAGDAIFAEPSTITGSIGVFGILPSFEGSLAKIGITTDGVRTTPLSGEPDILGGVSPTFNQLAQASVEDVYRRFVGLVAASRKLAPAKAEQVAEGRVWAGGTARQLGLVDRFGSLDDAVAEAARRAGLTGGDARALYLDPPPDPVARVLAMLAGGEARASQGVARDWLSRQAGQRRIALRSAIGDAHAMLSGSAIRADCLECRGFRPQAGAMTARDDETLLHRAGAWLMR